MKFASFDGGRIGIVLEDSLVDITDLQPYPPGVWPPVGMVTFIARFPDLADELKKAIETRKRLSLAQVRLETPIAWPNKVIAFPANYHAHVDEMKAGPGLVSTFKADGQGFFLKANSSLSGPMDPVRLPKIEGREIHHECELAIIIGRGGREIPTASALEHIFGYACLLDMVIRGKEERVMRKSFDTFCPVGPWITTRDEVTDCDQIEMTLSIGGELRQKANTRDLIVGIPQMIAMASSVMTLYPGDIIATGTPAGVGPVRPGDKLKIDISGVGAMAIDVVEDRGGSHPVWQKE